MTVILIIGVVLLVILLVVLGGIQEGKRLEALRQLAARLGLSYAAGKNRSLPAQYEFLELLDNGSNRFASNILEGLYQNHHVMAFDYHYETYSHDKNGRKTHHHHHQCYMLFLPIQCPEFQLYPENFLSRIGQALGASDIDFESEEFSRAFVVKCRDKKFAYDICHARMMEFLLRFPEMRLEIERDCLFIAFGGTLEPERVELSFEFLVEVRERFPEYLFQRAQ